MDRVSPIYGRKIMTSRWRMVLRLGFTLEFAQHGSWMSCWYCTTWAVSGVGAPYQWCRNLGLSFMDTTGWHQLGTVTTINTLQYGTNNMLRNNKHFENEHKVATADQAGLSVFLCVHLLLQWRSIELKRSLWFALSAPAWLSVCSLIILSSFSSV